MAKSKSTPRISKVAHNPTNGLTTIEYTHTENDGADTIESVLRTKDEPLPALLEALGALAQTIAKRAELPSDYIHTVRGVTLHRDAESPDVFTVTYTATRAVPDSNRPIVINTPPFDPPKGPKSGQLIPNVLEHALAFLSGDRAQASIPGLE